MASHKSNKNVNATLWKATNENDGDIDQAIASFDRQIIIRASYTSVWSTFVPAKSVKVCYQNYAAWTQEVFSTKMRTSLSNLELDSLKKVQKNIFSI